MWRGEKPHLVAKPFLSVAIGVMVSWGVAGFGSASFVIAACRNNILASMCTTLTVP